MRVTATFRPSLITPKGTWHQVTGEWDGQTLWFTVPAGEHKGLKLGVHLSSRTVLEPETKADALKDAERIVMPKRPALKGEVAQ